jgi:RNA polymerase sigma factor (sigma-70 family)
MANLTAGAALAEIGALFGGGTVAGQTDGQLLDRFLARRDPLAFEVLVQRHGPMVLAVCRGTLCDRDDTEDAFQATFLVLVRKAGSIRGRDSIGPWLHRVAHRVAVRANVESRRRREQERRAGELREVVPDRGPREEIRTALHEEIDRLPERLRRPLVLCHLEARTHSQAAAELQMGEATVRRRLTGARDLLRSRLGRRGFAPAAVALAAGSAAGAVPPSWASIAVRAAMAATFPGGIITPAASALSRRVARTIVVGRLGRCTASAAAVILTCALPALVALGARTPEDRPKAGVTKAAPPPAAPGLEFRGKVAGPGEAALAGARVMVAMPSSSGWADSTTKVVVETTSGADGTFRLEVPADPLEEPAADPGFRYAQLIATADGLGPAWIALGKARDRDVTLRLVADVPLSGRLVDLQGRPIAGARVSIGTTATVKGGDLAPYLQTVRDGTEDGNGRLLDDRWWGPFPDRRASTRSDANGKFTFAGLGRERLIEMSAEAPAIQHVTFMAMTREGETVGRGAEKSLGMGGGQVHGATFDVVVPPGRSITGVVREKGTGRPVPGMRVKGAREATDAKGAFTATGFAKGKSYELIVMPDHGQPYFVTCVIVPDAPGLGPIVADVECIRGVPFRLKLTDKATGKPVVAEVTYSPVYPNEWTRKVTGFEPVNGVGAYASAYREADGTYSGGVLPGPGAIFVRIAGDDYRPASVDPHEFFTGKPGGRLETDGEYGNRDAIMTAHGTGFGVPTPQAQFKAIVLTNTAEDSAPLSLSIELERQRAPIGRILGPDGRPLAGVAVAGLDPMEREPSGPLDSAEFRVVGLLSGRPRTLTFTHTAKRLSAELRLGGDESGPFEVRLAPWATLTGRLVDRAGKARAGVDLVAKDWQEASKDPSRAVLPGRKTDGDGRFRFEGLVAGLRYDARVVNAREGEDFGIVFEELTLAPGESRDLGDVRSNPE